MLTPSTCLILLAALSVQDASVVAGKEGQALDAYLSTCESYGFSGVVLVEREGELVLSKGYGVADPSEGTPNTPDTLYDIASASKQVTAAAVLLLEARGKLSVDDRLAEHLPDVPVDLRDITLAHLIHHTSGFPRAGPAGRGDDREAAIAVYLGGERSRRAGKRFEYWNGGYAVLAAVVEVVSERPFEDFVREELFRPAGLRRTGFIETAQRGIEPLAVSLDSLLPSTDYIRGWGYRGMGGVLTSASELRLWCDALFGGRVLPPAQLEWMLTPDRDDYAGGWYVFDTERKRRVVQHGGSTPSFDSYVRWFPGDEVLVLVLCNRKGWSWQVTWGLCELALGELAKAPRPPEPEDWQAQDFAPWLGTWAGEDGQRLVVERAGPGVRLGALYGKVGALLSPGSADRGRAPGAEVRAKAEANALQIVEELRQGRSDTLETLVSERLMQTWPRTLREVVWPAHVARWGELREARCLGSFTSGDGRAVQVWIGLEHERGARAVKIVFLGDELTGLDLRVPRWPVEARAAPVGERLVGFDFGQEPPFSLTLSGRSDRARLVLRGRDGARVELRRE